MSVTVWFFAERTSTRLWNSSIKGNFQWEVLPGLCWEIQMEDKIALHLNPSVLWRISRDQFDVVVLGGWDAPTLWCAAIACRFAGIPTVLWSGSVPGLSAFPGNNTQIAIWRRRLGRYIARSIVRSASTYIAYGTRSKRYLIELGASSEQVYIAWNTVDVAHFMQASDAARRRREHIRARLNIKPDQVHLLYVGRFQPFKNLDTLVEAYRLISQQYPHTVLGLVGYGPCETQLRSQASTLSYGRVQFYGHVSLDELPEYYTAADLFVLPSSDIWGLVVNEAMACGLPIVVADTVGCSDDLVLPGINGFVYPSRNVIALAEALGRLVNNGMLRQQMGEASRAHIQNFTYERAVIGLGTAIRQACLKT
jgi:glycosyltransferase involved in cell wall biosynthesis